MKRSVKYVGEDGGFLALLKDDSRTCCGDWTDFKAYNNLASYLRCVKQSQSPDNLTDGGEFRLWMRQRFAPVVLDLDFDQTGSTDVIHDIRQIDGGVPLIVISSRSSMKTYSITKIDGAEAFYAKSRYNMDSLVEGIKAAFDKIGHWERTLLQFRSTPKLVEHRD
jgi:DNA-binding NtrC family response regulator